MHKRLIIRLSSLGDVILASSVLELPAGVPVETHWLVKKEFAELLKAHPRIDRLWTFDKRLGLDGWLALCRELAAEGFDEVVDLQSSMRTRLAWLTWKSAKKPLWRKVSKERWKLVGYFLFKGIWPRVLRPEPWIGRHGRLLGNRSAKPDLSHLLKAAEPTVGLPAKPYFCLMPSSLWPAKAWPERSYLELIRRIGPSLHPVVLGTNSDEASLKLVRDLEESGIGHTSGVGKWSLTQVAKVLAGSKFYIGNDTGLSHLAESVGARAFVLFGPTTPEMGFGPSLDTSRSIGAELWCRPCGKDGRYCFRPVQRYLCMKKLSPTEVRRQIGEQLGEPNDG